MGAAEGKSKRTEKERERAWVQGTVVKSIPWKHGLHGWLEGRINWKGWLGVRQQKALKAQQGCVYLTQFGMGSHSRSPGSDITRPKLCLVNSNEAAMIRWLGEWETESAVQLLSWVRLFVTPWTVPCQASLFITNSRSLLKLMSIESVMPSNHLVLCHPLPPTFNISHHQGLYKWVSSLHQVAKVLEFQLQHQSFQWNFL